VAGNGVAKFMVVDCAFLYARAEDEQGLKTTKTYNSGYSLVVTHLTTNPPVRCLNRAERTGSLVFNVLWSYVAFVDNSFININI
jgi:hypothetical protein